MKRSPFISAVGVLTLSFGAFAAGPADEVTAAARKLADQPNYSWKQTIEMGGGGGGGRGPGGQEGKIEKGGFAWISMSRGETTVQAIIKGDKGAIKVGEGWKSAEEAAEAANGGAGGWNPARAFARNVKNFKSPAAQVEFIVGKVPELKKAESSYAGDMTEDGAKEMLSLGGRGGGDAPSIRDAKGSATFWIQNGLISKYTFHVQGKMSFNGNDREIDRTTTVEIKDVGATHLDIPQAAIQKAS